MKQLYNPITLHQLFTRSQLTIFILTFGICSAILLAISTYTMNAYAKNSLSILSNAINERVQPAVVFQDQSTMGQILQEYTQQYPIRSIDIFSTQKKILAHTEQQPISAWSSQNLLDLLFYRDPITLPIRHNNKTYGQLLVYGNSADLVNFFHKILLGLFLGFLILLAAVFWSVSSVYQYLMHSIRDIVESSQTISLKKNYTMRVSNSDIQELQALSTAFNGLLCEIEQSNQSLMSENNKLLHQSRHDPLTQLPNRHFFYETLFQYYEDNSVRNAAVLFIDLNDFKQVNDQFGHLAGDAVLRASSYCVRKVLPENAFFSRLGGDEFAVIIPDIIDSDEIQQLCQKIHACYTATYMFEQQHIFLDASIGVALTQLSKSPEDLISDADQAMYDAKNFAEKWHISLQSKSKQA